MTMKAFHPEDGNAVEPKLPRLLGKTPESLDSPTLLLVIPPPIDVPHI